MTSRRRQKLDYGIAEKTFHPAARIGWRTWCRQCSRGERGMRAWARMMRGLHDWATRRARAGERLLRVMAAAAPAGDGEKGEGAP